MRADSASVTEFGAALLVAWPYLMLRLGHHFMTVRWWIVRPAELGLMACVVALDVVQRHGD